MKNFVFFLLFVLFSPAVKAQSITDSPDWNNMIVNLNNEKWVDANRLAVACLQKVPASEQEGVLGSLLRYMAIFSESGLMNAGIVTQQQAVDNVKQYVGHNIALPPYPLTLKFAFNSIEMNNDKTTDTLVVCASNRQATNIHCFDYVILKDKWPADDFKNNANKMYRISGKLKTITANGHIVQRFTLTIDNAVCEIASN